MKLFSYVSILGSLLVACTPVAPEELFGIWRIDRFLVDGMKRDRQYHAHDDPIEWGSAVWFRPDGSFETNQGEDGQWRLNQRGEILLIPAAIADTIYWNVKVGSQNLVLETRTKKIDLSRTDHLPKLKQKPPNLTTNLPGTWYFYRWMNHQDTTQYPTIKKQAVWLTLDYGGEYRSGEGKHQSFRGNWQLEQNILRLQDSLHRMQQNWRVKLNNDTLVVEPASDTTAWFQAWLVREK